MERWDIGTRSATWVHAASKSGDTGRKNKINYCQVVTGKTVLTFEKEMNISDILVLFFTKEKNTHTHKITVPSLSRKIDAMSIFSIYSSLKLLTPDSGA